MHTSMCAFTVVHSSRNRRAWRSRASLTRSRAFCEFVHGSASSPSLPAFSSLACRSIRSSSGPLSLRRWRAMSVSLHRHRSWSPAYPHGHGLVAAISMNRAGYTAECLALTIATRPSSSGWRRASRVGLANSESSSRNSTPRWASTTSPTHPLCAPPTNPAVVIEWCGALNGLLWASAPSCSPAMLWMRVTSIASGRLSCGRIDGTRCASIVLPVPGGPLSRQLCPPAAAMMSARTAWCWPRTSLRSGPCALAPPPPGSGSSGSGSGSEGRHCSTRAALFRCPPLRPRVRRPASPRARPRARARASPLVSAQACATASVP